MGTIDAHLVAIDAKTGRLWDHTVQKVGDAVTEKCAITLAPIAIKDKIIVGIAGGDLGVRGFICAFDAKSGKELWRFYTVPGKGEPGNETWSGDSWKTGGAGVWNSGAYDAATNLVYFGTCNPAPDWDGRTRLGDNLCSDSVVALDVDTGTLKWHFQFTPHDEMDYDSTQVPVLADLEWQGRVRKVMLWANRNGLAYVIDRTTGQFLIGKPFVKVNWMDNFDPKGRPIRVPGGRHPRKGRCSCRPCSAPRTGRRRLIVRARVSSMSPDGKTRERSRSRDSFHAPPAFRMGRRWARRR